MRVALNISFATNKREPLTEMLDRVRQAFLDAGLPGPAIRFQLFDSAIRTSAVDRVLKRHPEMARFLEGNSPKPGHPELRRLSNVTTGEPAEYSTIRAIAAGVPRSYSFATAAFHFHAPVFGEALPGLPKMGGSLPGVLVTDNWWVNRRQRALSVYTVVEADEGVKRLPPNPEPVAAVLNAFGRARRTERVALLGPGGKVVPPAPAANAPAVNAIVADYRARIKEVVERAALPHQLPPPAESRAQNPGVRSGPRKPALQATFRPMGYGCRGGGGQFHLTRRTAGNLAISLYLDVGTWSNEVSAAFEVQGVGFKASLAIPVTRTDTFYGQYPIGDAAQWQKIVENLAAMVRELDRSFVPEIEQAAAPSPEWFQPVT